MFNRRIYICFAMTVGVIASLSSLLASCTSTVNISDSSAAHILDDTFKLSISAHAPPLGLLGKTIDYQFETKGMRAVGSETAAIEASVESSQIKILKTGEIYLFARPGAERGTVYKINKEIDVTKNLNYADPMVLTNTNVSVWRAMSTFSGSRLTIASLLEGVGKANGVAIRDQVLTEIEFSPNFQSCEVKRVLLKVVGPSVVHEQSLSRAISCTVS